jgi:hypothetical protein
MGQEVGRNDLYNQQLAILACSKNELRLLTNEMIEGARSKLNANHREPAAAAGRPAAPPYHGPANERVWGRRRRSPPPPAAAGSVMWVY